MALQSTEGKVSEVGMTSKDINEWEKLDMDRENPLKSVWGWLGGRAMWKNGTVKCPLWILSPYQDICHLDISILLVLSSRHAGLV